jgi:hypothetical protein
MSTNDATRRPSFEEAARSLLSPGSPFELAEEKVLGEAMSLNKTRARSLRELLAASAAHADKEYLVFSNARRWTYAEPSK